MWPIWFLILVGDLAFAGHIATSVTAQSEPNGRIAGEARLNANDKARPEWLDDEPGLAGDVYRQPVASGLFVTPAECHEAIGPKLDAAIQDYARRWLGPTTTPNIAINAELRSLAHKDEYLETVASPTVGPMRQLHVLLAFDNRFRDELNKMARHATLQRRLTQLLIGIGLVLGVLSVLYVSLSAEARNRKLAPGSSPSRLRIAATLAILLLVFCAMVAWRRLL